MEGLVDEQKQLNDLTMRVRRAVAGDVAQARLIRQLELLLEGIQGDVAEATKVALLEYRGSISENRDVEWARAMASIWVDDPATQVPRNPLELREVIYAWQKAREAGLVKKAQSEGYLAGWKDAMLKGVAFGWGAMAAGKSREEALARAENMKP